MLQESPTAKYDRLKNLLQQSILREYPNPQRNGCPGDRVVMDLAARPFDEPIEDHPYWRHVTHCAECYREFLAFTIERKRMMRVRRYWLLGIVVAVVLVTIAAVLFDMGRL